ALELVKVRWSAPPTVTENVDVSLVRPDLEAVIVSEPAACTVTVSEATPLLAGAEPRPVAVPAPAVLAKPTTVVLSALSRLPLASRISTMRVFVDGEAGLAVLLVNVRWSAGPTVTENVEVSLVRPVLEAVIVSEPAVWPVTVRLA